MASGFRNDVLQEDNPLQEAIKRAREIASKLPPKQTAKRSASEIEDLGVVKVTLAYDKPPASSSSSSATTTGTTTTTTSAITNNKSYNSINDNNDSGSGPLPRSGEEKIEIIIPQPVIGLVIGKGGENIKRVQSETGATVRVDPNTVDEQGNKVCTITGTKQAVTEAHSQVTQVIKDAATNKRPRIQVDGSDTYRMKIPSARTGAIIGKGGETIKQIKQQSGCDIELDKNSKDQDESVFIIRGTPDKITKARGLIESRLASRGREPNDSNRMGGGGPNAGGGGGGGGGGGHHKYHATGANATPVAESTDLAWGAYFAQYSSLFNPVMANPIAPAPLLPQEVTTPAPAAPISVPQTSNNPSQDYTDQWIEYYLAVGRPDYAEQTIQMKKQQQQEHISD